MSGSREHEHAITKRRPSPGIHWLVTHLESMTQLLVMRMRGDRPAACRQGADRGGRPVHARRSWPAGGRQPAIRPGPRPAARTGSWSPGRPGFQEAGPGQQPLQHRWPGADRGRPGGQPRLPSWWELHDGRRRGHGTSPSLAGSACRLAPKARCPARVPGRLLRSWSLL